MSVLRPAGRRPAGRSRHKWEGLFPAKDGPLVRHHIYDLGGATPWHRKLLVM